MILLVHMIFGVAVALLSKNPYLAFLLAFLSHYFLDLFPHVEYDIEEIKNKNWKESAPPFLRVIFDFFIGLILISIFTDFTDKSLIVFIFAFFAILPDGLSMLNKIFPNRLSNIHDFMHLEKIHFLKNNKKISNFWRISTQILVIIISVLIIKSL